MKKNIITSTEENEYQCEVIIYKTIISSTDLIGYAAQCTCTLWHTPEFTCICISFYSSWNGNYLYSILFGVST